MPDVVFVVCVPVLALVVVRFLDGAVARPARPDRFLGWLMQSRLWHVLVAVGLSACVFATFVTEGVFPLWVGLLVVLALVVRAWRNEFLFLMALRDEDLPGRYDKLIWTLVLVMIPPVGFWLFRSYREAHWPEPTPVGGEPAASAARCGEPLRT